MNNAVSYRAWPITCIFRDNNGNISLARMNQESNNNRTGLIVITGARLRTNASAIINLFRLPLAGTKRDTIGNTYFLPVQPKALMPRVTQHCACRNCGLLHFFA